MPQVVKPPRRQQIRTELGPDRQPVRQRLGLHTPISRAVPVICCETVRTPRTSSSPDQVAPQASPRRRRPARAISSHIADSRSVAASARNAPTSSASHGSTSGAVYSGSSTPIAGLNGIIRWRTASFSVVFSMS
ncbi:hypothetical protein [Frankia sp. EI5c]|uniref:hypothetical protein n=1 Tax=Frankia sp. EI5c TaxID=683316 RepID=UPI0008266B1D|nr:hypothetical protein [Frankia sp. EI5c]